MYHGMLTVYKEAGYTSGDAVARLRGILHMRKIGHTGTLDPDAEGVLPMCLGNATRICDLIADREKEYVAVMRLGVRTDTQDMSGTVLEEIGMEEILSRLSRKMQDEKEPAREEADEGEPAREEADENKPAREEAREKEPAREEADENRTGRDADVEEYLQAVILKFRGQIEQVPPMYSAIKVNGKRLYDMARRGITVERKARAVTIHDISVEKIELPLVTMRVRCSKGTYIRTLCEDIGNALGTGAAMQSLLRTRVGTFTLARARTLDEIEAIAKTRPEELPSLIRPVDSFFAGLPAYSCAPEALRLLKNGNALHPRQLRRIPPDEDPQRAYGSREGADPSSAACRKAVSGDRPCGQEIISGDRPCGQETISGGKDREPEMIRVYDDKAVFYGLYQRKEGKKDYTACKMFLPENQQDELCRS